jgi:hypothetical protein
MNFPDKFSKNDSIINFYENPSSGSLVVICGWTDGQTDGRTEMTKLTVAFRNFANSSINY